MTLGRGSSHPADILFTYLKMGVNNSTIKVVEKFK